MGLLVRPIYVWNKEVDLPDFVKDIIIKEFMQRREYAVEALNPHYEEWNKEFDTKYPDLDGTSKEYGEFITSKQDEVLKTVNKRPVGLNLTTIDTEKGTETAGDLICRLRQMNDITITLELMPVE